MNLGPFVIFDIVEENGDKFLQTFKIIYNIEETLNHNVILNLSPLNHETIQSCKTHNDKQVDILFKSLKKVNDYLLANPGSTKRQNQVEYLSNTYDHFVNWYADKELPMPDKPSAMEWNKGLFYANKNFSIIKIKNKLYSLRRNQPKIVEFLYQNLKNELDGLSYSELARELDLTSSGKLSNYFKDSPRVGDVFNYFKRTGKYSLKH